MPRLMSVALTEQAVVERRKTVTRRAGWKFLMPGTRLTLCRKVMGRKPDEPLVRITDVEVVSVTREPLNRITDADVVQEGFDRLHRGPFMINNTSQPFTPAEWFVQFYCDHMGGEPDQIVTRIEWRYLD